MTKSTATKLKPAQDRPTSMGVTVHDVVFKSAALERDSKYRILLPNGYAESTHRYPVLYLLHGVFGCSENWETLTNLSKYASSTELIIVMPDAGNSWYVNSYCNRKHRFEDLIIQDLMPEVEARWRTLRSSHRRAIAGLSMGGYGAFRFAIKYPDTFSVAASISGAFNGPRDLDSRRDDLRDDLSAAFGPPESRNRAGNDLFELFPKADRESLPYFYLDCGTGDEFCEVNRRFAALLCSAKVRYEYHELSGAHSWKYWDQRIAAVLPMIDKMLRPE